MKTDAVTAADLSRSVISVPPLARDAAGKVSTAENRKIVAHMAAGGVSTFLYGGNAIFYHVSIAEYGDILDTMAEIAPADAWMIPSIGADFGKAMDEVAILKGHDFPTAMALPMAGPTKPAGVATGLRRLSDAYGRPLVAYMRAENYLAPKDIASLFADGVLCSLKYAVERKNPGEDAFLSAIIDAAGTERLVSGMGERPAVTHWTKFRVQAFTSGSVTIAPRLSMGILNALKAGDAALAERLRAIFLPFEDLRDVHSQIIVLHDGVRLAGIADCGPVVPYLTNLEAALEPQVGAAARKLLDENTAFASRAAA